MPGTYVGPKCTVVTTERRDQRIHELELENQRLRERIDEYERNNERLAEMARENELLRSNIIQFRDNVRDKVRHPFPGHGTRATESAISLLAAWPQFSKSQARRFREQESVRRSAQSLAHSGAATSLRSPPLSVGNSVQNASPGAFGDWVAWSRGRLVALSPCRLVAGLPGGAWTTFCAAVPLTPRGHAHRPRRRHTEVVLLRHSVAVLEADRQRLLNDNAQLTSENKRLVRRRPGLPCGADRPLTGTPRACGV